MPIESLRKKLKSYNFKIGVIAILCIFSLSKAVCERSFHRQFMEECSKARSLFEAGDYAAALKGANEAKELRKMILQRERQTLLQAFKNVSHNFEKFGLEELEGELKKKKEGASLCILKEYLEVYGSAKFGNSPAKLLSFISSLESFPEADFLIGDIYKIEGEYVMAREFYLAAYQNACNLDVPPEVYDILYALSDTALLMGKGEEYEKYLLTIIGMGESYKDKALMKSIKRALKNNRADAPDKFFNLYRSRDFRQIRAFCELSEYYGKLGEKERELYMSSFGALASFTRIYELLDERSVSRMESGFVNLLRASKNYPDIIDWGNDNYVWRCFHFFALSCLKNEEERRIGQEMVKALSKDSPVDYWRKAASLVMQSDSD